MKFENKGKWLGESAKRVKEEEDLTNDEELTLAEETEDDFSDLLAEDELDAYINEDNEITFAEWFGKDLSRQSYSGTIKVAPEVTSLLGMPKYVKGKVDLQGTSITSLQEAPEVVEGDFNCLQCTKLTSLKGAPKKITGTFYLSEFKSISNLSDLSDTTIGGSIHITNNYSLTSLKGLNVKKVNGYLSLLSCEGLSDLSGCPVEVTKYVTLDNTNITSLKNGPEKIGEYLSLSRCQRLSSLEGFPKYVGGIVDLRNTRSLTTDCSKYFKNSLIKGKILATQTVLGVDNKLEAIKEMFKTKPEVSNIKNLRTSKFSGNTGNSKTDVSADIAFVKPKELSKEDIENIEDLLAKADSGYILALQSIDINVPANNSYSTAQLTAKDLIFNYKPVLSGNKVVYKSVKYTSWFVYD